MPMHTIVLALIGTLAGMPALPLQGQDCSAGRFQDRARYSHDESLPFDFDQPAGWIAESMTAGQQYVTVHKPDKDVPLNAVVVSVDLVVAIQPDLYPDMTEDVWRQTMEVVDKVPYGDETLVIYSQSWATTAKFLVPHRGRKYQVIISFNNSEYCGAEAARLRDLVIHSLAPNRDTTFPGK